MIPPSDAAAPLTARPADQTGAAPCDTVPRDVPEQLRLAPGRVALWRSPTCLQVGLDPQRAMVLDELPEPLAALLKRMDGVCSTTELLNEAQAAGSSRREALTTCTAAVWCRRRPPTPADRGGTGSRWPPRQPAGLSTAVTRLARCCGNGARR